MAIYATSLTNAWKQSFEELEALTGFEPLHQEAIDEGAMNPQEAWERNIAWLESLVQDASNIRTPYFDPDKEAQRRSELGVFRSVRTN